MAPRRPARTAPEPHPAERPSVLKAVDWRHLRRLAEPLESGAERIVKGWNRVQRTMGLPLPADTPRAVILQRRTAMIHALAEICRAGRLDAFVRTVDATIADMDTEAMHLGTLSGSLIGLVPAIEAELAAHTGQALAPPQTRALNRLLAQMIEESGRAVFNRREALAVDRALDAERERDQLQRGFYLITDAIPGLILLLDGEGNSLFVNRLAREFLGVEGDGVTPTDSLAERTHPEDVPLLGEAVTNGLRYKRPQSFELRLRSAAGGYEPFWIRAAFPPESPSPVKVFFIAIPLTERQQRENQSHEDRRQQSLASLTGGIAHEFNNLLNNVLGRAQYLAELTDGHPQQVAEDLAAVAKRGARLVRRLGLLTAAQPADDVPPTPAGRAVGRALEYARPLVDPELEVRLKAKGRLPRIAVDPNALLTAVVELLTNAREAMATLRPVEIVVTHRKSSVPGERGTVRVAFHDRGPGVPQDIADRVFDAFVTTKPPNVAAGLGLAVVQGIARRHGGTVRLERSSSRGATFSLVFPVA